MHECEESINNNRERRVCVRRSTCGENRNISDGGDELPCVIQQQKNQTEWRRAGRMLKDDEDEAV